MRRDRVAGSGFASSHASVRSPGGTVSDSFVHLHVHTEYTMLDGAAQLKDMFAGRRLGMPAVAMTDHGNMYGAYDFYSSKAAGVKPIIGIEAYLAPESRPDQKPVWWGDPAEERRRLRRRRSTRTRRSGRADDQGLQT